MLPVDRLEEIANWLFSWAGRAKVIQPAELRELLIQKLQLALKMQQDQKCS